MLESGQKFDKIKDITTFFGKTFATQAYSYDFAIYKAIKAKKGSASKVKAKQEELKKYIFIIDEINRGEISKIFGELFFAIDPGLSRKSRRNFHAVFQSACESNREILHSGERLHYRYDERYRPFCGQLRFCNAAEIPIR